MDIFNTRIDTHRGSQPDATEDRTMGKWLGIGVGLLLSMVMGVAAAHDFGGPTTIDPPPPPPPDRPCNTCPCNTPNTINAAVGDPIWTYDGSLHLQYSDLEIGNVFPIRLSRNYDSRSDFDSALGYGWAFTHDRRLFEFADGSAVLRTGCGSRARFVKTGGAYVTPNNGPQGQLKELADGSYEFRYSNGNRDLFDAEGRLVAIVQRSGARHELSYDTRGKLPLIGTSARAVDPSKPMVVAYQPRLTRIQERGANGALTGYAVDFQYNDSTGRLTAATASDGRKVTYAHDDLAGATRGNLSTVTGLDNYSQTFAYADPNDTHNLTTIADGTGAEPVVNTYNTLDQVTRQVEANSTWDLAYLAGDITKTTQTVRNAAGTVLQTRVSMREFNANGYLSKKTDALGNEERYTYNPRNDLIRTELWEKQAANLVLLKAVDSTYNGQSQKLTEAVTLDTGETITTTWTYDNGWIATEQKQSTLSAQVFRTEYEFVRDAQGVPINIAKVKRRKDDGTFAIATYTYCTAAEASATNGTCPDISLVKQIDGPRADVSDVITMLYYGATDVSGCSSASGNCHHRGNIKQVVNALGQKMEYLRYDSAGRVTRMRDANLIVTDMTYHPRGWMLQQAVRGPDDALTTDDQITGYDYDARGNRTKITTPDGNTVVLTYDTRDRLTAIRDQAGNEMRYTLDSVGNLLKEEAYDPTNVLKRTQSAAFDVLDRRITQTGSTTNQITKASYDGAGRPTLITDPNLVETTSVYDDLDRLARSVGDSKSGGIQATTLYGYDAAGNLRKVTDPKGLATNYTYDALSRLTTLVSPDTGTTAYTYDDADNRSTQTDARNITSTYGYDALNRLATIVYPTAAENVTYVYDVGNSVCAAGETFAVGRLSKMTDPSGTTEYCYDRFGNLVRKVQTTAGKAFTVRYAYTKSNQLLTVTYPDGSLVDYGRDTQTRISAVGVTLSGASRQVLLSGAAYYPMGPSSGWTYGNGRQLARVYDKDYRPQSIKDAAAGGLDLGFGYDPAGNLTQLKNGALSTVRANYGYDPLNRLLRANEGATTTANEVYGYDATGNRTTFAAGATATKLYTYPATSHRLSQIDSTARIYDANGNTTKVGGTAREFIYNNANRMVTTKQAGTTKGTYLYNGRGEQVRRVSGSTNTVFVYDEGGMLLGQYTSAGVAIQQYVWMDDQPVGVISGNALHYVEPDHLGTPRSIVDAALQKSIWAWDLKSEAFGNSAPNVDPDADGTAFVYDLRFPGQRYDAASGLNYNYFRDYDPSTGRYSQSDPIGLGGGISTYAYVRGNPISRIDPLGLSDYFTFNGSALTGYTYVRYAPTPFDSSLSGTSFVGTRQDFSVPAVSGPHGKGRLPAGSYGGRNLRRRTDRAMTCPNGNGFSLDLDDKDGRELLRIHPDGNVPGTLGCVGVVCGYENQAYNAILDGLRGGNDVRLDVDYGDGP